MVPPQRIFRELLVTRTELKDVSPGVRVREDYFIWTNPEDRPITPMELFSVLNNRSLQE